MKKIVLATTALVSVAYAGSALAQESMVMSPQGADASLGGFYEFGYTNYTDKDLKDDNGADSGSYSDSEIFISFSRTTDNGLTFGMDAQLESITTDDKAPTNTDEAWLYIQGDFGEILLGENDHASDSFQTWAPTHDGSYGQDDGQEYPQFADGLAATETNEATSDTPTRIQTFAGNPSYNDSVKITYLTPDFSGFRFGVSWEDSRNQDDGEKKRWRKWKQWRRAEHLFRC